ncbi:uncharacterized protein LOC110027161 [Phalaenopsis equestris]|uniref:uncharacterized protein LOC110027161 n=1 Tax=Phalaenopsis equestris TaxID=78828 RepID=UPI0009E4E053|nr:uncharacterized protein LOC110027161 [Phalaenopsis equestris]
MTSRISGTDRGILCYCGLPSSLLTLRKEHSFGRQFYGCVRGVSARCSFFRWADSPTYYTASSHASSHFYWYSLGCENLRSAETVLAVPDETRYFQPPNWKSVEMRSHLLPTPICSLINFFLLLLLISSFNPSALSASRRAISEDEIRNRKNACYVDIESGLWGWKCRTSVTEKENCALRCLSSACYQLIYESDPLEEGERDDNRSHEYKYCLHRESLGESLEGVKGVYD